MIRRRLPTLLAGIAILAVTGSAIAFAVWSRDGVGSLPTTIVSKGTFVDYLQARGEVRPVRSVVLTAPSSGTDMQILQLVANGATVNAGDVVVQFDTTVQERNLEQRRSELKQAESEIARVDADGGRRIQAAETELAQARSAASRAELDTGGVDLRSRVESERFKLLHANARHQVTGLEQKVAGEKAAVAADLALARQKRNKAEADVADTERIMTALTLRAPASGAITILPNGRAGGPFTRTAPEFRRGDRVWFGAPIAELPDLSTIQMSVRLDEADRARVQTGTRALVRVDAIPDRELTAAIRDISLVARPDFTSFPPVRNFDAIIRLDETDPRLRTGMSATARIELNRLNDVIVVPTGAIFQVDGGPAAYVVERRSATARPVAVIRRGRDQTAIGSGLREGERIALRDPSLGSRP